MATGGDAAVQITSKAYQEFLLHQQRIFQGYSRRRRSNSFEDVTTPVETAEETAEDVKSSAGSASMSIIRPVRKPPETIVAKSKRKRGRPRIKREQDNEQNTASKARVSLAISNPNSPVLLIDVNQNHPFPQSANETIVPGSRETVSRIKSREPTPRKKASTYKSRQSTAKISSKKGPKTKFKTIATKGKASANKHKTPGSQSKSSMTKGNVSSLKSKASATPASTPSQQKHSGQSAKKRSADSGVCLLKFASKALNYKRNDRNR